MFAITSSLELVVCRYAPEPPSGTDVYNSTARMQYQYQIHCIPLSEQPLLLGLCVCVYALLQASGQ